jgi:hypothetical protein
MLGLDSIGLRDIDQELKEAVCNAIVNLTIAQVSGGGPEGQILYGPSPRRSIVSGQLLPRFDQAGQEDETTDIRIAAIGIDFQIVSTAIGEASITPQFSVYLRVLPSWEELSNEGLGLDVEFKLNRAVQLAVDARMRQLRDERFAAAGVATPQWSSLNQTQKNEIRATRAHIQEEVRVAAYLEQGIILERGEDQFAPPEQPEADAQAPQSAAGGEVVATQGDEGEDARLRVGRLLQRGQNIPYALLDPADPPTKWRRLDLTIPTFRWALNADPALELERYSTELRRSALEQVGVWFASTEGTNEAWRDLRVQPQDILSAEAWANYRVRAAQMPVPLPDLIPKLDAVSLQIDRITDYVDPSRVSIRAVLDNRTPELSRQEARTRSDTLFGVGLTLTLPASEHRALRLDRVEPSYRFRHFLSYPAIGLNCGINSEIAGDALILRTSWSPRFVQPRILPREIALPVTFRELGDENLAISTLSALPRAYEAWIAAEEERLRLAVREGLSTEEADIESQRLADDIAAQRQEVRFIERGVRLLEESQDAYRSLQREMDERQRSHLTRRAAPYRAWLLTNQSFLRRERNNAQRGWRLFQIAFILAHVPTLASRMNEYRTYQDRNLDEDAASLLYFPTGGGKSEAFYGTLLFAMFLDRLRGKNRGVTAMVRYPLRLLTLQQGQRLLKLIAYAELVRREQSVGSWPFEIGFWVGGANTPNRYSHVPSIVPLIDNEQHPDDNQLEEGVAGLSAEERKEAQRYREYRAAYNKVPECPVCRSATGLRRFQSEGPTAQRLAIICFNPSCAYNSAHGGPTPLPFLLTDDTIYERAPSVVLGTIDKMAMLGQHTSTIRHLLGMFGLARGVGPTGHLYSPAISGDLAANLQADGYSEVFPVFRNGRRVFVDPFPSLVIQDEAHLLEESLGTFSGLFDTLLETTFRRINDIAGEDLEVAHVWSGNTSAGPRMPKIIAATATISNPDRQLEVLYQRRALRFPYPGSDIYSSFFAAPARAPASNTDRVVLEGRLPTHESPEFTAPWMRLYVSLMTNDATHTVTTVAVLSAFHSIITALWNGLGNPALRVVTIQNLRRAQGTDVASGWRRASIDRALTEGRGAEIMALVDLHRVALAYVTNKKGGDQVMDALDAAVRLKHRKAQQPIDRFISRLISGGIDMKEIQEIMEEAEAANPDAAYPPITERIRSIVATSAISHGVDVDRFNSMFFAGLPSDIAEYIQASSRVGRTHVGFVLLVPTPQSRRDRYVVETHDIFHRFLERMIAPPAVERWAENAIRRVMASMVQTWALLKENELLVQTADTDKPRAQSYDVIAPITSSARRDQTGFIDELGDFVLRAIGFQGRGDSHYGQPAYGEIYRALIEQEVSRFAQHMRNLNSPIRFQEYWTESGAAFKPPMTSLRDVDEAGIITAGAFDMHTREGRRRIDVQQLIQVMRSIRNQRGLVAETDSDAPEERPT